MSKGSHTLHKKEKTMWRRGKFALFILIAEAIFIVLFAVLVRYGDEADANPKHDKDNNEVHARRRRQADDVNNTSDMMTTPIGESMEMDDTEYDDGHDSPPKTNSIQLLYPMFQDVHVMMFIGFGYLMTFLKRYGFSSVGFNFLICAFVIQWATIMGGFLHLHDGKILITINEMLTADFACAAVLISFGAVLGKASPIQLLVLAFLEIVFFQVNEYIGLSKFNAVDVGGSMFVHVFGAYFGITVARVLYTSGLKDEKVEDKASSHYHSDLFSVIGTLFLWMFWPSFNSAVAPTPDAQHRAVLNTYYALCACTLTTFALSSALDEDDKLEMEHIQNATLAGGVAVGTFADMMIGAWGAMLVGVIAGAISTCGYKFLSPLLTKVKFHDTCGVNNLHGMPGLLAGLGGIVVTFMADQDTYGTNLYKMFPARAPENATEIAMNPDIYGDAEPGEGFSAEQQAGMQAAALGLTLAMAIVGGLITGIILKIPIWNSPEEEALFEDRLFWHIPAEGYPRVFVDGKHVSEEDINLEINDKLAQSKV